jgi:hypothetical protein
MLYLLWLMARSTILAGIVCGGCKLTQVRQFKSTEGRLLSQSKNCQSASPAKLSLKLKRPKCRHGPTRGRPQPYDCGTLRALNTFQPSNIVSFHLGIVGSVQRLVADGLLLPSANTKIAVKVKLLASIMAKKRQAEVNQSSEPAPSRSCGCRQ